MKKELRRAIQDQLFATAKIDSHLVNVARRI
jgi:hypothetical protein